MNEFTRHEKCLIRSVACINVVRWTLGKGKRKPGKIMHWLMFYISAQSNKEELNGHDMPVECAHKFNRGALKKDTIWKT